MAPKTQKERGFDNAKLQAMHEPLTVRVVKIKANTKQPIEIPGKDGQAPGCGLGREDVLKLEGFIREWSGGGYYEGQVTDANGLSMEWPFGWDPRLYPEKIPPTDTQNVNIGTLTSGAYAPLPAPMMMPMQMSPTSAIPNLGSSNIPVGGGMIAPPGSQPLGQGPQGSSWPPPSGAYMQYPQQTRAPWLDQQPQQQQAPTAVPTPAPVPYPAPYQPGISDFSAGRRFQGDTDRQERERERGERERSERDRDRLAAEERARNLEDQLRRADLERKEIEHKALMERQAQQHASDMAAMREEIRRVSETNKGTENDEIRRAREEKERIERQAERDRQAAERAAERAANDQRFSQLQEMIARMGEKVSAPVPVVDTSALDKMREMERKLEQERHERDRQAERERAEREREKERYEREREREKFEQQLLAMQATQAQALANLQSNRPDPMVELMREQSRMQAETAREIARAQDAATAKMAGFMVNPMEMMRVIKDSSQGSDQMIRNIVDSFSGVFGTYRAALESVAQIQGSGAPSPMVGIIQDGLSHGKDVMEQWLGMQRDKGVAEAKAKQAEAQASGMQAQAAAHRATLEAQRMGPWQAPPPVTQQAPQERPATPEEQARYDFARQQLAAQQAAAVAGGGLNGHAPAAVAAPTDVSPQALGQVAPTPNLVEQVQAEIIQAAAANIDPTKLPELITAADIRALQHPVVIESVSRLRKGVRAFVESKGKKDPKTKKHKGLKPEEAANGILQGVAAVHQHKIVVPAFTLFQEQRFADMTDLLLVGSPQAYRDEVAQILRARAMGEVPDVKDPDEPELDDKDTDDDGDDDDGAGDGDEDGDDDQPGA